MVKESVTNKATAGNINKILSPLMNHGIKRYMRFCYTEKESSSLIEIIFDDIILTKLTNEYQNVINYQNMQNNSNMSDNSYYVSLVFNTNDLMHSIFEYISDYDMIILVI